VRRGSNNRVTLQWYVSNVRKISCSSTERPSFIQDGDNTKRKELILLYLDITLKRRQSICTMLETVAVIGAGASGLVAARHLINAGLRPTIFEIAKNVGGAWTPSLSTNTIRSPPHGGTNNQHPSSKMWTGMHTNLSKYTCRFSDWPWPEDASAFPSVEEMHEYLESYAAAFLSSSTCDFHFECKVFNVELLTRENSSSFAEDDATMKAMTKTTIPRASNNYKVEWNDLSTNQNHRREFGGVIVATGFFNTPRWPSFLAKDIGGGERSKTFDDGKSIPQLIHSSEYRTHYQFSGKTVAVVGSSFSALEIASDITQSAKRVINICSTIPWVLPRWITTMQPLLQQSSFAGQKNCDSTTITILSADLVLYKRRQPYPKIHETIFLSPKECRERHQYLQSIVGHKQRHSALGEPPNFDEPPFVAISDEYLDLVREEKIEVAHGRLVGIGQDGKLEIYNTQSKNDDSQSNSRVLDDDIDHIICCTGYAPNLHTFLSPLLLAALSNDPDDVFAPVTLAWDTLHPSLPNLAFCGMYRGPYMGVMELQARLAAGVMSGHISLEEEQLQSAVKASEAIRNAAHRPQFPHFDYPGFMDTLSQLCCQQKGDHPTHNVQVGDAVIPTFYQADENLSQRCLKEINEEVTLGQDGSRLPKVVLQSILGNWSFDRNIIHFQTRKTERVYGTVTYTKYRSRSVPEPSPLGMYALSSQNYDNVSAAGESRVSSALYREDGLYELSPTQTIEVYREYEYEVRHDVLEIFFVEGGRRTYLFLSLKFVPDTTQTSSLDDDGGYWVKATSDHLCIKDLYSATFRVKLNGTSATEIIIKYRVKGPSKDYESTTILRPQS